MKHLSNFDRTHFHIKDVYDHTYLINNTVNIEKKYDHTKRHCFLFEEKI